MVRLLHYSDIENVYDDPDRLGRFAGLVASLDGEDALVVGTGDDTSPGVAALVARGRQSLDLFRAIGTDLETFGNHDFDYGPEAAESVVADSPQTWVSANVYDADGERFGASSGVEPWAILEVDGASVGAFGVTDPATPSLNPMAAELRFGDPYEAAAEAVSALRERGVDYVIALSHLGAGDDELAKRVDVDAVLGGHVHRERIDRVNGTLLTRPGVNGEAIVEIRLGGDEPTATRRSAADAPRIEEVADAVRSRLSAAGVDEPVARASEPVPRDPETVHGGECRIGNFVADAYRWEADADVGLQNSGGIRSGTPLSGEVTLADLISVLPFAEPIVAVELTGAELLEAFRQLSGESVDFGEDDWWHGHVSGAEIVWDERTDELLEATVGGEPVDPDRIYTVATAEYLLHSDHEFPAIERRHRSGEFGIQHEVLAAYAKEFGVEPRIEGRIRRVGGEAADAGGVRNRR